MQIVLIEATEHEILYYKGKSVFLISAGNY